MKQEPAPGGATLDFFNFSKSKQINGQQEIFKKKIK
jgi:hypothetical protein